MSRSQERDEGLIQLNKLLENRSRVLIIHYSCESFINPTGRAPRITSISILRLDSDQAKSFAIHLSAQILKLNILKLSEVEYDICEKHMLDSFFSYLRSHRNYKWVHWKMKNTKYGFEAINLRYEILDGAPVAVPDRNKFDLSELLAKLYSSSFEKDLPDGKLLNLARRNKLLLGETLTGKLEAEAFVEQKFQELYFSTLSKVKFMADFLNAASTDKLKIAAHPLKVHGISLQFVRNHKVLSILYVIGTWVAVKSIEKIFDALWQVIIGQETIVFLSQILS